MNEAAAPLFLAEDVFLTAISAAYNRDGLEQAIPVMRRTSGVENLHFQVMHLTHYTYFDARTGASAHPDMVVGPLNTRKAVIFSPGVDTETHLWLRRLGYETVEVDYEEHLTHYPANLTILEPGKVIMQSESPKTVALVRRLGVEVIEVPYSEFNKAGGGMACSTLLIRREVGPSLGV